MIKVVYVVFEGSPIFNNIEILVCKLQRPIFLNIGRSGAALSLGQFSGFPQPHRSHGFRAFRGVACNELLGGAHSNISFIIISPVLAAQCEPSHEMRLLLQLRMPA
jgi:hypothetical protein